MGQAFLVSPGPMLSTGSKISPAASRPEIAPPHLSFPGRQRHWDRGSRQLAHEPDLGVFTSIPRSHITHGPVLPRAITALTESVIAGAQH